MHDQQRVLVMLDAYITLLKREFNPVSLCAQRFYWGENTPTAFKNLIISRVHAQGLEIEMCSIHRCEGFAIWIAEKPRKEIPYEPNPEHQMGRSIGFIPYKA